VGNLAMTLSFAVILLAAGALLTRRMINPLNALSNLMRRAEAGESRMRAAPAGPRDLIEMAHAFNKMMNVLEQREAELKESRDAAVNMAADEGAVCRHRQPRSAHPAERRGRHARHAEGNAAQHSARRNAWTWPGMPRAP
jgi:HAMP domain-containing protein